MKLLLGEKPAQTRDIAKVIGLKNTHDGYFELKNNNWGIDKAVFSVGHLLALAEPEEYNPKYKRWNKDNLPFIIEKFKYIKGKGATRQLKIIKDLLKDTKELIIATDPDREGDYIGLELIEFFNFKGEITRINLAGLDKANITKALNTKFNFNSNLGISAKYRNIADWIVGLNITRILTIYRNSLGDKGVKSVGRVQSPTTALIFNREQIIKNFVSEDYFLVSLDTGKGFSVENSSYIEEISKEKKLIKKLELSQLKQYFTNNKLKVNFTKKLKSESAPKLYDLTLISRELNKNLGWSAKKTLEIAQKCYETHKITTYPRTDNNYLPEEQKNDIPKILNNIVGDDNSLISNDLKENYQIKKTIFNTEKVAGHHAIIPTGVKPDLDTIDSNSRIFYDFVTKRYLLNLAEDHQYDETKAVTELFDIDGKQFTFTKIFKNTIRSGFKKYLTKAEKEKDQVEIKNLDSFIFQPNLAEKAKKTMPPAHYTEATLLADMENIAKYVENKELKDKLQNKEKAGIGTTATRSGIIENIKKRNFIKEELKDKKKHLRITDVGVDYINSIPEELKKADLTAQWELELDKIAQGKKIPNEFKNEIDKFVYTIVNNIKPNIINNYNNNKHKCDCGNSLVLKKGKYGEFFSCSDYPNCKKSYKVGLDGEPVAKSKPNLSKFKCLKCKKPLILRKSKYGEFFSCSDYPNCKKTYKVEIDKNDIKKPIY